MVVPFFLQFPPFIVNMGYLQIVHEATAGGPSAHGYINMLVPYTMLECISSNIHLRPPSVLIVKSWRQTGEDISR
jgi:hypothetical protein